MLADDIAEGKFSIVSADGSIKVDSLNSSLAAKVKASTVVSAGTVEEYCKSIGKVSVRELPCITPPFPMMIVYGQCPGSWVVYLGTDLVDSEQDRMSLGNSISEAWREKIHIDPMTKWAVEGVAWGRLRSGGPAFVIEHQLSLIDSSGHWLRGWSFGPNMTVDEEATSWIVCVAFTTVSFMHCKNVVQRVVAPPPKLSKRHKERHGRPLFSYRVLEIEPMKQVLRTEGRSEEIGLAKALHICRGHFKDYREHGLFGRNKGLYWWDQHVRGSIEAGIAAKDYSVKAPTVNPNGDNQ